MNYSNIKNCNQRQFNATMKRECITVSDYYDSTKTYDVFFRRSRRGSNPQGKVRIYFSQDTPIDIGTVFVLKDTSYVVTSRDGDESDIFYTSMAVKCDTSFTVFSNTEGRYVTVPCAVIADEYTLTNNDIISIASGSVTVYTGDNSYTRDMSIGETYYNFGGYYKVGNTFYNNGLAYVYMTREAMPEDRYTLEDIISKMGTSIYVNTLNPMPVAIGQRIESSIPADATGYVLNLDVGDFKYASCNMDYNTIKLYLDNLKQFLNDVACIPSVLGSNTNISNISEVSMQILLMMASVYADENKKWLNIGFNERFNMFKKILNMQGIKVDGDVDVIYNVSMPIASTEMIANLKALQEMGAISRETIMEKSEYITDVDVEKKRLQGENVAEPKVSEVPKDKEDKENP